MTRIVLDLLACATAIIGSLKQPHAKLVIALSVTIAGLTVYDNLQEMHRNEQDRDVLERVTKNAKPEKVTTVKKDDVSPGPPGNLRVVPATLFAPSSQPADSPATAPKNLRVTMQASPK